MSSIADSFSQMGVLLLDREFEDFRSGFFSVSILYSNKIPPVFLQPWPGVMIWSLIHARKDPNKS